MLLSPLADSIYRKRTPQKIDRSVEENGQLLESTTTFLFTETNKKDQFFSKETPLLKSEINTNSLLAGAGAVIFILLIIIVIQTSRKSKSAKGKSLLQHKCNENQTCDETFKPPPNGDSKKYCNLTSSKQSNPVYQHMDSVYHEIDESMELMPIPASTDTTTKFGDNNLPKCINNPITVTKNDELNVQTSESYVLPSTESICPDKDKTDYLQPVFFHANIEIERKQETHSYIDVTG